MKKKQEESIEQKLSALYHALQYARSSVERESIRFEITRLKQAKPYIESWPKLNH